MRASKLISLQKAAAPLPDGTRIALGGFAVHQYPLAFVRELVRQVRQGLVGVVHGNNVDTFADTGRLARCSGIGTVALTPEQRCKIV